MERPFDVRIGQHELSLTAQNCVAVIFRNSVEVNYLAVDITEDGDDEENTLRIFNNPQFVGWLAGIAFHPGGFHNVTRDMEDGSSVSFADYISRDGGEPWNPSVIIKNKPTDWEVDMWVEVNTRDLDGERDG